MNRHVIPTLVAGMVVLAGCAGFAPAPEEKPKPTAQTAIYLSDAPIDEFKHLNVTITKVGVSTQEFEVEAEQEVESEHENEQPENESDAAIEKEVAAAYEFEYEAEDWNETSIEPVTIDLTRVKGERAIKLADLNLSAAKYNAVYVQVTNIEGTLKSGEKVTFTRTSGKILLTSSFAPEEGALTDFVFDVGVQKTSSGYVLLPDASQSGVNIPFVAVEYESENLNLRFIGDVQRGQQATIVVTDTKGNPVEGATVEVNGEPVGKTNASGRASFTVPTDASELEISVEHKIGEASIEYDFGDTTEPPEESETETETAEG